MIRKLIIRNLYLISTSIYSHTQYAYYMHIVCVSTCTYKCTCIPTNIHIQGALSLSLSLSLSLFLPSPILPIFYLRCAYTIFMHIRQYQASPSSSSYYVTSPHKSPDIPPTKQLMHFLATTAHISKLIK